MKTTQAKPRRHNSKIFVPNWESFKGWTDFMGCFEMMFKAMDIGFSEELYNRMDDKAKRYFKLKESH